MGRHKAGDTVCIRSREWIDAQEKNDFGGIVTSGIVLIKLMFEYAGRIAMICNVWGDAYRLDIDGGAWLWADWMLDPDYKADGPLAPKDAARAMLEEETLYNRYGAPCVWDKDAFALLDSDGTRFCTLDEFTTLYHSPPKRRRPMTPEEARAWAESDESLGWMVKLGIREWTFPRFHGYGDDISHYRRARILPDMSGVDESTIQGFEVEE
jgi:hypothetical protein